MSHKYAPPFATLASVQNAGGGGGGEGGGGLYAGCNNFLFNWIIEVVALPDGWLSDS